MTVFSQTNKFDFPQIREVGQSKSDFIPKDWKVRQSIFGDLNKDNLEDCVLVIETIKPLKFDDKVCFSSELFYPKMLVILFKNLDNKLYLSTVATKLFGECNWGVQGSDPFDNIFIRRNTLGITFLTGGTLRNYTSYILRFQNNDWFLVGEDNLEYWAGHTEGEGAFGYKNINYLTGTKETYETNQRGDKTNIKRVKYKHENLRNLKTLNCQETSE